MTLEPTGMGFQDFIEHVDARIRKWKALTRPITDKLLWKGAPPTLADLIPDLSETHLFYLGEDEAIQDAIRPIRDELSEECRDRIPTPFKDVSCISKVPYKGKHFWVLDRLIEDPPGRKEKPDNLEAIRATGRELRQHFLIMRHTEFDESFDGLGTPMIWEVWYMGNDEKGAFHICTLADRWCQGMLEEKIGKEGASIAFQKLGKETTPILEQLAVISHPQNYVVKVTPELTTKESNRVRRGEPRPVRKAPHFIVVDHDVLVRMSRPGGTSHASPVPHERRGHWRRLAERCRLARESGKARVFVKTAYVGEREFGDEKNRYEVVFGLDRQEAIAR
jgi:hypothetical protein